MMTKKTKNKRKPYTTCENTKATEKQKKEWNRMVQDLERRDKRGTTGT